MYMVWGFCAGCSMVGKCCGLRVYSQVWQPMSLPLVSGVVDFNLGMPGWRGVKWQSHMIREVVEGCQT